MSNPTPATTEALAARLDKLYEFEREPVSQDKLHGGRRFAALFAGEHVAATEFVIGALFVQWGASASDLIWGLVLGNLLAVLSWAFICAPIAVRTRITLYWYARRIIGPGLTVIYNIVNAMLYCCLAAAMIGVSGSAVILALNKIPMIPHIKHPELTDVLPNSVGWVLVVLGVGAVVVLLAILGFKKLSQFSSVCAPWMFLVFIGGALASLPKLGEFNSVADLWRIAETSIWKGEPQKKELCRLEHSAVAPAAADFVASLGIAIEKQAPGKIDPAAMELATSSPEGDRWELKSKGATLLAQREAGGLVVYELMEKLGFWHIAFFGWFCNLAMHVGLSDMALFRYARKWYYGFYSALGMYLGHFLAWICAGVMGAVVAAGLNPGEMADTAAGAAGVLAVLIAGWTTANPTIYRAGLALQIVTPNWPRWKVTFAAGAITTVAGFFPAIFMKLLDFVAIYGLTLMPIGAVIVVEHWLFPKLGLRQYWADKRKMLFNPAALISWAAVLVICFPIEQFTGGAVRSPMAMLGVHLFYRWLPGWFIAAILYIVLAAAMGAKAVAGEVVEQPVDRKGAGGVSAPPEKGLSALGPRAWLAGSVALLALAFCIVLPLLVFLGGSDPQVYDANMAIYKKWFMVATVVYFIAAIVWAGEREKLQPAE